MPVLPLVASITVWPGFSSPDCSAASITPSASRSLTEPNGLKASTFTNRFTPGGPSLLIFTTGVLPTVSRILSYRATLLLPSRHSQSFDQRRRSCATHGFPSEPAAPVPGDCSSVRGPESRPTCARNSCQKATLRNLQHPMAGGSRALIKRLGAAMPARCSEHVSTTSTRFAVISGATPNLPPTARRLRRTRVRWRCWTYRWELHHLLRLCGFMVEAEYSDFGRSN